MNRNTSRKQVRRNKRSASKAAFSRRHFACFLPPNTGFLSQLIFRRLFSGIKIRSSETQPICALKKRGSLIFINKYKNHFEFYFYHTRFQQENIPHPSIGLDYTLTLWQPIRQFFAILLTHIRHFLKHLSFPNPYNSGYIYDKLTNGEAGLLSLVEEKGFYRRFVKSKTDPFHFLIEMQKSMERPIIFVPQLMLFSKSPETTKLSFMDMLFGTAENPGRLRRLVALIKNPKKIIIETGDFVFLPDFLNRPEIAAMGPASQAVALRRFLLMLLNRHRQTITGPILKSRLEIMEEMLTNQKVQKSIVEYGESEHVSMHQAHKRAVQHLDEIASNYNLKMIRIFDVVLRWVFKHIFEGMVVDLQGLERIKRTSKKGPLILVPCHKSHLDYLVLSYIFFNNNMPCPLIAAGRNLSFWPLGPIFRGGGAFFLRRTFKGDPLYPRIFAAYIEKILAEGFNIEFFIEGGRSRTGKLLAPKVGLLSLLIEASRNNKWQDMFFVPIYIGYDRVLEESAYIHEIEGGKKTPENLKNVLKARKFLKKKYGKIYLNFHEPFSLREYLDQVELPGGEPGKCGPREQFAEFGRRLVAAINRISVVTPHAVVAAAILNSQQKRFYYNQLMDEVETYMTYLMSQNAGLADTLMIDRISAFDHVLESFAQNRLIEKGASEFASIPDANPMFKVIETKRPALDYYKNNGIIHFIPAAFTALGILKTDAFQFSAAELHSSYNFLQEFFENEFIFDAEQPVEVIVRKNLKSFIDDAIIMPHPTLPDTYNITSAGFRKLNLFAAFLVPYFEAYWTVLNFIRHYTKQSIFDVKDYLNKIESMGIRMYKRNEIQRRESLSLINYKNAVSFFTGHGLINPDSDHDKIEFYKETIQQYRRYLPD